MALVAISLVITSRSSVSASSSAICEMDFDATFVPGLTKDSGQGLIRADQGTMDCVGKLNGRNLTSGGTIDLLGSYEGGCGQLTAVGTFTFRIRAIQGTDVPITGTFRATGTTSAGDLTVLSPVGIGRGTFDLTPALGPCAQGDSVTRATVRAQQFVFQQ